MKISQLSKDKKIELINRLRTGDAPLIVGDEIVGDGVLLIQKEGEFFLNGETKVNKEEFDKKFTGTVILLPDNNR